jgi:hypothetical protein
MRNASRPAMRLSRSDSDVARMLSPTARSYGRKPTVTADFDERFGNMKEKLHIS